MFGLVQRALAAVVTLAVVLMLGCGPTIYINQVTRRASAAVAAAKTANAEKYAPYHYTLAIEYLHKAREEAAHADYQAANRFGRKAEEAAVEAKTLAVANAADPDYQPPDEIRGDAPAGADTGTDKAGGGMAPLLPDDADSDGVDAGDSRKSGQPKSGQPKSGGGGMAPLLPDSDSANSDSANSNDSADSDSADSDSDDSHSDDSDSDDSGGGGANEDE